MISSAILVARVNGQAVSGLGDPGGGYHHPVALMPAVNRPLIARIAEELQALGVRDVVVLVDRQIAARTAAALGDADPDFTIRFVQSGYGSSLLKGISSAREILGAGPFLLRFADSLNRTPDELPFDAATEIGPGDAVSLAFVPSEQWAGGEGDPAPAQAGMFLLGERFPESLAPVPARSPVPLQPEVADDIRIMTAALQQMRAEGGRSEQRLIEGWWRYLGQADPILSANRFCLSALPEGPCEGEVTGSSLQGQVICGPGSRIDSSVIRGPVVVGPGTEISSAFVGPFTTLGPGVRIEGAELENSVILEGSSIQHSGVRLDSSVLGPRASIYRDFGMPRRTSVFVGPGSKIALQ